MQSRTAAKAAAAAEEELLLRRVGVVVLRVTVRHWLLGRVRLEGPPLEAVEDDHDLDVAEELHVHGRDADARVEQRPFAAVRLGDSEADVVEVRRGETERGRCSAFGFG